MDFVDLEDLCLIFSATLTMTLLSLLKPPPTSTQKQHICLLATVSPTSKLHT